MNEVATPENLHFPAPMKVFISHGLKDGAAAGKLAAALRTKGFQVTHAGEEDSSVRVVLSG